MTGESSRTRKKFLPSSNLIFRDTDRDARTKRR